MVHGTNLDAIQKPLMTVFLDDQERPLNVTVRRPRDREAAAAPFSNRGHEFDSIRRKLSLLVEHFALVGADLSRRYQHACIHDRYAPF